MKFLAMDHGLAGASDPEKIKKHLHADVSRVWELYTQGIFREIYQRGDNPFAVIILECASIEAARQAVNSLPFAQEGITAFEIIPLGPFVGLNELFAASQSNTEQENKA